MKSIKLLAGGTALALVAGCGPYRVEALRDTGTVSTGSTFTQALTREYRSYTLLEADRQRDWPTSYYFADKGLAAAEGQIVLPEQPENFDLSQQNLALFTQDRQRLLSALDNGARANNPQQAARAQAAYDCMLDKANEPWNVGQFAICRGTFESALAQLTPPPAPVPQPVPQVPLAREFTIYFAFDSARLDTAANQIVNQVIQTARQGSTTRLTLAGHTDRAGSEDYNLRLSLRRADAVRSALIAQGIAADRISVTALGESEPAVQTADGVREPLNRRVVVTIR